MVQWRRVKLLLVQDFHLVPDWPFAGMVRFEDLHTRSGSWWSNYLPLLPLQIQGEVLAFAVLQLEDGGVDFPQHWTGCNHRGSVKCTADAAERS